MNLSPPRGTRDFPPEELRLRTWLFGHFRAVAHLFAFEEYDAPVVESEELYVRKAGEQIVDQLYTFKDKSGRRLALRPEMTPSLARLVLQKGGSLALPLKWFSVPQCWRYERTARGRRREHFQWNMDVFGVAGVAAEAELLAAIVTLLCRLGLGPEDVAVRVSSRKILEAVLADAGVPEERFGPVCVAIDKLEKVPREALEADLAELEVEPRVIDRVLHVAGLESLDAVAEAIGDDTPGIADLQDLFDRAASYGIGQWLRFDASLVRGFAYYTGIVFEAFDTGSKFRSICGGGRYDRLLSTFGGDDIPACGFGFGDAVIIELLRDLKLLPQLPPQLDDVIFAFDSELRDEALGVAQRLRSQGRSVDLVLEDKKMKWAFRHADQVGAARLVLLAPDEWSRGCVRTHDMATGEEAELPFDEL